MTITIDLAPGVAAQLQEKAAAQGQELADYVQAIAERDALDGSAEQAETSALDKAVAAMTSRTPEQIAESRKRALAASPTPRPLPPGKTLADVVAGKWPGDETDEQI